MKKEDRKHLGTSAVGVMPSNNIRGCLLPAVFGISESAAAKYRQRGTWLEGTHFWRDPAGQYIYSVPAISQWQESTKH
ncbi:hypothetical protein [Parahaliea mediterranea]|uniref:hypothetical protein n=1 Tax=Parahaliea mediterranea TaxID=651086 RepID=UPI0019D44C00|nr:hypothetical protein [Parahaliea mediterranea]